MGEFKGYDLLRDLLNNNKEFRYAFNEHLKEGKIRTFGNSEWEKIESQTFYYATEQVKDFKDVFIFGLNIGNCTNISKMLSYSYDDVDIVSGTVDMLVGTKNAPEGDHCWLETDDKIIDTSLMLVIDKSLKEELGYHEEQRITRTMLRKDEMYQMRKEMVNANKKNR